MNDEPDENVVAPDEAALVFGPTGIPRFLIPQHLTTDGCPDPEAPLSEQGMWILRLSCLLVSPELIDQVDAKIKSDSGKLPRAPQGFKVERHHAFRKT